MGINGGYRMVVEEKDLSEMSKLGNKLGKRALVDFDGTLHAYKTKFTTETEIHDGPIDGAIKFIMDLLDAGYDVAIFSTRASEWRFKNAAIDWFEKHGMPREYSYQLEFTNIKGHHEFILDDRAINFGGKYPSIEELKVFKPWNKREPKKLKDKVLEFIKNVRIEDDVVLSLKGIGINAEKELMLAVLAEAIEEVKRS